MPFDPLKQQTTGAPTTSFGMPLSQGDLDRIVKLPPKHQIDPFGAVRGAFPIQDSGGPVTAFGMLAQQARGLSRSPIDIRQQIALEQMAQQQALMAAQAPSGMNPALAQAQSGQQMSMMGPQNLASLAQARSAEQQQAQQALMMAQYQQRQMQAAEAQVANQQRMREEAARLAQQGSIFSGLTGLASSGIAAAGQRGGR